MPRKIEISHRTIIFTVFFLGFLWFLYYIRDVLLQVFVALLIMTILNPTVSKLNKRAKIPRAVSVLIVYILVFAFLSASLALTIPAFVEQTTTFAVSVPEYLKELRIPPAIADGLANEFSSQVGKLPSQIVKFSVSIVSNVMAVFTVFIFALYFLLAREKLDEQLTVFFRDNQTKSIEAILDKLEKKLGGWARGEIILMCLVGALSYIGFILIGVPFALPLAVFAGLFEIIPNVGPVMGAVPAIIVGFSVSPLTGLAAAALGVLVQQVENYVFVPKIMQRSAGVSPVLTLLALVIGFRVAGIVGALLSVPVVITSQVILEETIFSKRK